MRARLAILIAGSAALGGCAYGYGGYGPNGGLSVGVGYGSGYGGYYGGYGGYGGYPYYGYGNYGYGNSYWGWYDDYYYPGTGYYVYDRYRRPHVWNDRQKRYWSDRRERWQRNDRDHDRWQRDDRNRDRATSTRTEVRENWSGFERPRRAQTPDSNRTIKTRRSQRSDSVRPQ